MREERMQRTPPDARFCGLADARISEHFTWRVCFQAFLLVLDNQVASF